MEGRKWGRKKSDKELNLNNSHLYFFLLLSQKETPFSMNILVNQESFLALERGSEEE